MQKSGFRDATVQRWCDILSPTARRLLSDETGGRSMNPLDELWLRILDSN